MSLRNKLIRLAHAKPELRKDLLPLLKEASSDLAYPPKGIRISDEEWYESDYYKALVECFQLLERGGFRITRSSDDKWVTLTEGEIQMRQGLTDFVYPDSPAAVKSFLRVKKAIKAKMEEAAENTYKDSEGRGDMFYDTIHLKTERLLGKKKGRGLGYSYAVSVVRAKGVYVHS